MNLVADTNIIIAAILRSSTTQDIIFNSNVRIYAPEYLMDEIIEHKQELIEKMEVSDSVFESIYNIVLSKITIVPKSDYSSHKEKAISSCPDPQDWPFFVLAFHLSIPLWSNDLSLKRQKFIRVIDTKEIIKILSCGD